MQLCRLWVWVLRCLTYIFPCYYYYFFGMFLFFFSSETLTHSFLVHLSIRRIIRSLPHGSLYSDSKKKKNKFWLGYVLCSVALVYLFYLTYLHTHIRCERVSDLYVVVIVAFESMTTKCDSIRTQHHISSKVWYKQTTTNW